MNENTELTSEEVKAICDGTDKCSCDHKHKKEEPKAKPVTPRAKIGRNQPCVCGSGKKYKKCCLLS